jgi:hypothetical protein
MLVKVVDELSGEVRRVSLIWATVAGGERRVS